MAAQGYVLGMVEAARLASAGAPASTDDLNTYLGRCALDLFSIIMFGELSNVSNTTTPTYPENKVFVIKCCQLLERFQCCFCPIKWLWGNNWGLPHKKISLLLPTLKSAGELCMQKLNDLVNKNAMTAIKKCKHLMLGWGPRLLAGRSTQCENEGSLWIVIYWSFCCWWYHIVHSWLESFHHFSMSLLRNARETSWRNCSGCGSSGRNRMCRQSAGAQTERNHHFCMPRYKKFHR